MKSFTGIEQSKKLIELGIDINTADMFYLNDGISAKLMWEHLPNVKKEAVAWSLSSLLELIPKHIKQEDGRTYKFHIFNDDGRVIQRWGCSYVAEDYHNRAEYLSDPTLKYPTNVYSGKYDNPLDAAFEMVVWLKENNKI